MFVLNIHFDSLFAFLHLASGESNLSIFITSINTPNVFVREFDSCLFRSLRHWGLAGLLKFCVLVDNLLTLPWLAAACGPLEMNGHGNWIYGVQISYRNTKLSESFLTGNPVGDSTPGQDVHYIMVPVLCFKLTKHLRGYLNLILLSLENLFRAFLSSPQPPNPPQLLFFNFITEYVWSRCYLLLWGGDIANMAEYLRAMQLVLLQEIEKNNKSASRFL